MSLLNSGAMDTSNDRRRLLGRVLAQNGMSSNNDDFNKVADIQRMLKMEALQWDTEAGFTALRSTQSSGLSSSSSFSPLWNTHLLWRPYIVPWIVEVIQRFVQEQELSSAGHDDLEEIKRRRDANNSAGTGPASSWVYATLSLIDRYWALQSINTSSASAPRPSILNGTKRGYRMVTTAALLDSMPKAYQASTFARQRMLSLALQAIAVDSNEENSKKKEQLLRAELKHCVTSLRVIEASSRTGEEQTVTSTLRSPFGFMRELLHGSMDSLGSNVEEDDDNDAEANQLLQNAAERLHTAMTTGSNDNQQQQSDWMIARSPSELAAAALIAELQDGSDYGNQWRQDLEQIIRTMVDPYAYDLSDTCHSLRRITTKRSTAALIHPDNDDDKATIISRTTNVVLPIRRNDTPALLHVIPQDLNSMKQNSSPKRSLASMSHTNTSDYHIEQQPRSMMRSKRARLDLASMASLK